MDIIDRIVKMLGKKYKFGYYDLEDMMQEGRMLALKAIETYDEERPLENFLSVYIKNRFINLKRDKYFRATIPCVTCPFYDLHCKVSTNQCAEFTDKMECERYAYWYKVNRAKQNLIDSIDIDSVDHDNEKSTTMYARLDEHFEGKQLRDYIEANISIEFRADYLKMMSNADARKSHQARVPKARAKLVRGEVKRLMKEFYGKEE